MRNKHSHKMADKRQTMVFTFVHVRCRNETASKPIFGRVPSMERLSGTLSSAKMRLLLGKVAEPKAIK